MSAVTLIDLCPSHRDTSKIGTLLGWSISRPAFRMAPGPFLMVPTKHDLDRRIERGSDPSADLVGGSEKVHPDPAGFQLVDDRGSLLVPSPCASASSTPTLKPAAAA